MSQNSAMLIQKKNYKSKCGSKFMPSLFPNVGVRNAFTNRVKM